MLGTNWVLLILHCSICPLSFVGKQAFSGRRGAH